MEGTEPGALAQALASRVLATMDQILGDRRFSLRFFLVSLLATLCVLAAAYLAMLLAVGARAALFYKYGLVFVSTLTGLAITRVRGADVGLSALAAISFVPCALDRSRLLAYPILLVLAIPGLVLAPLTMHATRWALRRAQTSRHATAWMAGIIAVPFACLSVHALSVSLTSGAEWRFSTFLTKLGLAAAISCNLLLSTGVLAAITWGALRLAVKRSAAPI